MNARILFLVALLTSSCTTINAANCPFCTAVSQTLRQEIGQMDVAVVASFVSADSETKSTFAVKKVLRGENLVAVGDEFSVDYFGKAKPDQLFLLMGIDPPVFAWSSPQKLNENNLSYIDEMLKLPKDSTKERLRFYLKYLSDKDPLISRDVFDEFASASYSDMVELKENYNRQALLDWIRDTELSPDRRRMYLVMLGICGQKADADIIEKLLLSDDQSKLAGLDAMIACYLTLKGESGLKLVNEQFLTNKEVGYNQIYPAVMALRFHGNEGGVIDRKAIIKSMQLLLDQPKLADLVIPDLARFEDWSNIPKLVKLFKDAEENKTVWIRIPVINYLKACPLPEAAAALEELKQLDPASYKRATEFFPVQPPSTSSSQIPKSSGAPDVSALSGLELKDGLEFASLAPVSNARQFQPERQERSPNLLSVGSVLGTMLGTLWVGMWLTITGAGRQPKFLLRWLSQLGN
jgi:hypothetical protein